MNPKWWPKGKNEWVNLDHVVKVTYHPSTAPYAMNVAKAGGSGLRPVGTQLQPGDPPKLSLVFMDTKNNFPVTNEQDIKEILERMALGLRLTREGGEG